MPGKVPGTDSQGREEGTTGPGSKELQRRWQTLLCPWGRLPALSQCWVAAARPLLAPGDPLCLHPSPTCGHQSVGMCVWQVPACHAWVSAAIPLLTGIISWFWSVPVNADGLSVPGDVLWGGSTGHWAGSGTRAAVPGLPLPPLQCPAGMASAEPEAEDAAEAEEAVYEVMPCERMEQSQRLAVEELITTEASYVHNLQLCVSDIRAHLQEKQVTRGTSPCPGGWGLQGQSVQSSEMPQIPAGAPATFLCSPSKSGAGYTLGLTQHSHFN